MGLLGWASIREARFRWQLGGGQRLRALAESIRWLDDATSDNPSRRRRLNKCILCFVFGLDSTWCLLRFRLNILKTSIIFFS